MGVVCQPAVREAKEYEHAACSGLLIVQKMRTGNISRNSDLICIDKLIFLTTLNDTNISNIYRRSLQGGRRPLPPPSVIIKCK